MKLARGIEAAKMLASRDFRSQWLQLYHECPWATAVQNPGFAASWYESYQEHYSSVLVCEFSATNALTGFLALGVNRSGQAIIPGGHQAEYEGWLALPPNSSPFITAALALLSQEMKVGALQFRYLPCGAPVDGMCASRGAPWTCELETYPRPIVRLRSAAEITDYQRQKANKSIKNKWNRLKRLGDLRLERILECGELIPIFDQLIDWYDTRQEVAHGRRPFQIDKNKKAWHLSLLKEGLLHVTVLKAGQDLVSALFGLSDGKTYSVMMPVFAPAYAEYSPVALHHLMLVQLLHAEGYSVLDLTPGPDEFKDRFAGEYDSVQALSIYFTQGMDQGQSSPADAQFHQTPLGHVWDRVQVFGSELASHSSTLTTEETLEGTDNSASVSSLNAARAGGVSAATARSFRATTSMNYSSMTLGQVGRKRRQPPLIIRVLRPLWAHCMRLPSEYTLFLRRKQYQRLQYSIFRRCLPSRSTVIASHMKSLTTPIFGGSSES